MTDSRLLRAQKTICGLESAAAIQRLETMTVYVMRYAEPDDLGSLPDPVRSAFAGYASRRAGSRGAEYRGHSPSTSERDPLVLAGPLALAVEIVSGSAKDARERLQPIVDHVVRMRPGYVNVTGKDVGLDHDLLRIAREAAVATRKAPKETART